MSASFVVYELADLPEGGRVSGALASGSAYECALALLRRCDLQELYRLKLKELLPIQREVGGREGRECRAKAAAELDEDGDGCEEPTDVVAVEPLEPSDVWDEDYGQR